MKKIILFIFLSIFFASCSNQQVSQNENNNQIDQNNKEIEAEIEAYNAAQQTINEIETTSSQDMSQALQDFLKQEEIDYDSEIQKTLNRYNDNFGPILEYKHEPKPEEENNDDEINSNESETQTGSITEENQEVGDDENTDNQQDPTNELDDKGYSDEVDIPDTDENKSEEFTTITKNGKSGTYISYTPQSGKCNGGLKMIDNQENEKWLFSNTCDKIIYDFELDFGGINVFFKDENGTQGETFVTIE